MMRRRLMTEQKRQWNYIKIKINVTTTSERTEIISSDFAGVSQVSHITFNAPDGTTQYSYDTGFQFTWTGERVGYIHFHKGVTTLENLFSGITTVTEVDLNELDTRKVTSMSGMCMGCSGLVQCLMSGCRGDALTSMVNVFNSCTVLKHVDFGSYITGVFKPKKLTDIRNMFNWCKAITSINMSMFDLGRCIQWGYTWGNCHALTEVYLNTAVNADAVLTSNMFINSTATGAKLYYNGSHDYSGIAAVMGSNWTLTEYDY